MVAVAALSGCVSTLSSDSPATAMSAAATRVGVRPSVSDNLLYVVDIGSSAVMEYTFKPAALRFAAILNGVQRPYGACVDASQNIWVMPAGTVIVRFAHGAIDPDATLSVRAVPIDCSVDSNTGNLAVLTDSSNNSTIDLFKGGRGRPSLIPLGDIRNAYCSYDGDSDLFIIGNSSAGVPELFEVPSGSESYKVVTMKNGPSLQGGIAWDGTHLDIADSSIGVIDRFKLAGSIARLFDSIPLEATGTIGKFGVSGKYLVVPFQVGSNGFVNVYSYPAGGKRLRTLRSFTMPRAAVVSRGPKAAPSAAIKS
jgi:hypothetical protein